MLVTAVLFPGVTLTILGTLNTIAITYSSSATVPFVSFVRWALALFCFDVGGGPWRWVLAVFVRWRCVVLRCCDGHARV